MSANVIDRFDSNVHSTLPQEMQTVQPAMTLDGLNEFQKLSLKLHLTGFQFDEPTSEFLDLNIGVALKIPEMVSQVNSIIGYELSPQFELVNDEETGEVNGMVIRYKIKNKTYEEILDLWDKVSEEVCKNLDIETSKKISIILDGD